MATKTKTTLMRVGGDPVFKRFQRAPAFTGTQKTPKFEPLPIPAMDGSDPVLQALIRKLGGDRELAKRILSLQKKFPVATIPELLVYNWLQKEGYSFEFQVEMYGGRNFSNGLVVDFLLPRDGTSGDVWPVNGMFWHSIARKGLHDQTSSLRMLGQIVRGVTVARVIELWEDDILNLAPQVYYYALAGISMRGWGGV